MTILLIGGTGKTGVPLARLISTQSTHPVILASRKGIKPEQLSAEADHPNVHAVKFDWFDRTSWTNPFDYVTSQELSKVHGIYLIAPMVWDVEEVMSNFIDYAIERGACRYVFLSASQSQSGGPSLGKVHAYIEKVAKEKEIEWAVFRPTWFIENLGEYQVDSIRNEDKFPSVWEDGKVPFVSAEDIARFVYDTLVNGARLNTDWIIHGPELYTNDQLAALLSEILSRPITHTRITAAEYLQQWGDLGYSDLAQGLVDGELRIARGSEESIFKDEKALEGSIRLRDYIEKNKHLWIKN